MGRISSSDNKEQWRKSQKRHTGLIHAYGTVDRHGAEKQGAEPDEKGHGREQRCQRTWLSSSGLLFFCFLWASKSSFSMRGRQGANDVWHAISVCVLRLQVEQGRGRGRAMVNIILLLQLHHAQAEMHRRKCTGQSTRSKHTPTIKRAWMRKFNTK